MNNGKTFEEACVSGSNVGILLGKHSGLLDIDLDCKEAVAPWSEFPQCGNILPVGNY